LCSFVLSVLALVVYGARIFAALLRLAPTNSDSTDSPRSAP
jgi:hypothetical protein